MASLSRRERYRTNKQDLEWTEERAQRNVGDMEVLASGLTGAALVGAGILRRSWLGAALVLTGAALLYRGMSGHCALYQSLGINTASDTNDLGRRKVRTDRAVKVEHMTTINCRPEELYRFWRNLANLASVMGHVDSVDVVNERLSHWVVKGLPGGPRLEWDAEIVNEIENELIGWRSLAGADVDNAGSVRFKPARDGQGTDMTVMLQYDPPAGRLGTWVASMLGEDPKRQIQEDLQRFKDTMESKARSHT